MSGISTIVDTAISDFKKEIEDKVEQNCKVFCRDLMLEAIEARRRADGAFDFTGNLITSIVACLYKKGNPIIAYYAANNEKEPIAVKMSERKRPYGFPHSYNGAKHVHFKADVKTNMAYGIDDAKNFFRHYRPKEGNMFDIVVAYPVEYADWVESQRQTTGFMWTKQHAEGVGLTYLQR